MKEGNECYLMCGSFLLGNYIGYQNSRLVYTGYQNSRLVHKQQPAEGAAPGRHVVAPQVICSKPRPQVSRWLGHNIP